MQALLDAAGNDPATGERIPVPAVTRAVEGGAYLPVRVRRTSN